MIIFLYNKRYPESIKLKLLSNYHIFLAQKRNYLNIYQTYDFYPDSLTVVQIKKIVESWINYADYISK